MGMGGEEEEGGGGKIIHFTVWKSRRETRRSILEYAKSKRTVVRFLSVFSRLVNPVKGKGERIDDVQRLEGEQREKELRESSNDRVARFVSLHFLLPYRSSAQTVPFDGMHPRSTLVVDSQPSPLTCPSLASSNFRSTPPYFHAADLPYPIRYFKASRRHNLFSLAS